MSPGYMPRLESCGKMERGDLFGSLDSELVKCKAMFWVMQAQDIGSLIIKYSYGTA